MTELTAVVGPMCFGASLEATGYRAELEGKTLVLNVGFSHPVPFPERKGITWEVEDRGKRGIAEMFVGT